MTTSNLPPPLPSTSITTLLTTLSLPPPTTITPLPVSAAFHTIYLIHYAPSAAASATPPIRARADPSDGSITLVLRISGTQIPRIKTLNEVGVMTWVRRNTSIPVPAVIAYSASRDNPLGYEFTLLERVPGVSVAEVYEGLDEGRKRRLVEQVAGFVAELHGKPWEGGYVGGLQLGARGGDDDGEEGVEKEIVRGPPIEETYWQTQDVETYWSGCGMEETLETLNPFKSDGYASYTEYNVACVERYIHAISIHPSLSPFKDLIPRLEEFISVIGSDDKLNDVPYVLAHKDLHFANIMCDPSSPECPITGILDWEFASVVPAPRWNPVRAFLWNYRYAVEDKAERDRLEGVFEEVCKSRGQGWVLEGMKLSERQEGMQRVVNHVRAIVEVGVKGAGEEREGKLRGWREMVEGGLRLFNV
ncbi:aminoglycoside phosphotransferase family protein [Aspergillus vadensis CBS 113365]|uniref:APH-domain-containing protein n=1 Tax=Aspergillus vadensis (strain CBS 113365 / IMI 142717 / IBT 24658) TaxID=1448311 RepID=A0A319BKL9_ASPVC|nr:APH-domain-containing protein [Aspergillus vadensis CBS 113365]PYH73247.1 APH-domain-containing protein [Aspergillus vadensis CBS 113365]